MCSSGYVSSLNGPPAALPRVCVCVSQEPAQSGREQSARTPSPPLRFIFIRDLEPRLHMRPVAVSCIGGLGSSPKSFKNRALQDLQRKRTETVYR